MLIRRADDLRYSEVTPKHLFLEFFSRRKFLYGAAAGGALLASRSVGELLASPAQARPGKKLEGVKSSPLSANEKPNPSDHVSTYNNYYEFGTAKEEPAKYAKTLKTYPWTVKVEGDVKEPVVFDIDTILKLAPLEERIYRLRCVEAWSVVVPWIGFSLSELIRKVQPTSKAKYVAFETLFDLRQMPQARFAGIPFPYVEGLRMDEAMHPLTLLCVGMYGEVLPNQNGAPVRIVVPWKYGFKSIKSIVKIRFQEKQPPTTWSMSAPSEYGFYSNVNPNIDHPRWSQATERRLGEFRKRKTLPFNGYADQVAQLYAGMDLKKNY
ncbi:MAG: protein-methionine-sulfoxide reductase catalytic subunit MsrP [Acidobacteria bacterium]|nr:protein-methionine-sulfoxide reductase catalytic subunit MsrP [Acidobacteriota bacterium]